jgi:hypothetical protein
VSDETFTTSAAPQVPLGPRLMGLAIICVLLFGLATIAGLLANAYA